MKIKKVLICLFVFIINIMIQNVYATDYTCSYIGTYNDTKLSANIIIYSESKYDDLNRFSFQLIFDEGDGEPVINTLNIYNYSYEWDGGSYKWENLYNDESKTLKEYYNKNNACPPFLAIFGDDPISNDVTIKSGVATDYSDIKTTTAKKSMSVLELLNPSIEESDSNDPSSEGTETNNIAKACEVNFLLKYLNDKEETIRIDYTLFSSNKTVTSSTSVIVGDTSKFFSNNLNCLEKVYACVYDGEVNYSHPTFIAVNQENMKNKIFETLTTYDTVKDTNISKDFKTYKEFCPSGDCDFEADLRADLGLNCGFVNAVPSDQTTIQLGKGGCPPFQRLVDSINLEGQHNKINVLKNYCNTVTKRATYSSRTDSCIYRCLNLSNEIKFDIIFNTSGECGFSQKLVLWIANIIRWVKYIVPVVVIVLGILDFIKAMSADKEDEMKKAQQRFIRRLIAAALIFITPFIIEFILNKLGFDANGCGIINL